MDFIVDPAPLQHKVRKMIHFRIQIGLQETSFINLYFSAVTKLSVMLLRSRLFKQFAKLFLDTTNPKVTSLDTVQICRRQSVLGRSFRPSQGINRSVPSLSIIVTRGGQLRFSSYSKIPLTQTDCPLGGAWWTLRKSCTLVHRTAHIPASVTVKQHRTFVTVLHTSGRGNQVEAPQFGLYKPGHIENTTSWSNPGLWHHITVRYKSEADGLPEISDQDLEEHFTRGHGPGGQSVNKTTNCVVLRHKPTGIFVKVHESRSQFENRKLARLRLRQKLDWHYNGEESIREIKKRESSMALRAKKKKTNERLAKLKAFKEREGLT